MNSQPSTFTAGFKRGFKDGFLGRKVNPIMGTVVIGALVPFEGWLFGFSPRVVVASAVWVIFGYVIGRWHERNA